MRRSPEGRFSARQAEAAPAGCRDDAVERQRPCVLRGLDSRQPCRAALRKVNARTAAARGWRGAHRQRRRDVRAATRCGQRAARRASARRDPKTGPQALPSAEAPIRPRRAEHPVIQTILARRSDQPSRSRHREAIAGGPVFRASGRGGAGRMSRRRGGAPAAWCAAGFGQSAALKGCATEGERPHRSGARVARRTSSAAARRPGGDAMRPARCSPQRQRGEIRKPVRRRSHRRRHRFVPGARNTSLSKRSSQGFRIIRAGAAIVRRSPEGRFSARQAEAAPPGRRDAAAGAATMRGVHARPRLLADGSRPSRRTLCRRAEAAADPATMSRWPA